QQQYPADFWINHYLFFCLRSLEPSRYDDALRFESVALALRSQSAEVHLNVGYLLWKKEALDEALVAYQNARRLKPDYPLAHNNIGVILSAKGQFDRAIAA